MAEPETRAAAKHDLLAPLLPAGEPVEQLPAAIRTAGLARPDGQLVAAGGDGATLCPCGASTDPFQGLDQAFVPSMFGYALNGVEPNVDPGLRKRRSALSLPL